MGDILKFLKQSEKTLIYVIGKYRYFSLSETDTDTDTSIVIWTSMIPIPILVSLPGSQRYRYLVSEAKVSVTDTNSITHP